PYSLYSTLLLTRSHAPYSLYSALLLTRAHAPYSLYSALLLTRAHAPYSLYSAPYRVPFGMQALTDQLPSNTLMFSIIVFRPLLFIVIIVHPSSAQMEASVFRRQQPVSQQASEMNRGAAGKNKTKERYHVL
ncbi:hypothetical protein J4Q44_G00362490, partial [Coregonus suidteri]